MTKSQLQEIRKNANATLKNIQAYVAVHLGRIDDDTRANLIDDAREAFQASFDASAAQGLPVSSITAQRAAEHYLMGCTDCRRNLNS